MQAREQTLDTDWSIFVDELAECGGDDTQTRRASSGSDGGSGSAAAGAGSRSAWHILMGVLSRRWF
jgi:hypothetical protein